MKNWLPDLFNRRKVNALELQLKAIQNIFSPPLTALLSEQVWGKEYNSTPAIYPDWTATSASNAYITIDQVYSVVNKIAETTSLIPYYVYYQKDDRNVKRLKTITNRLFYTAKGLFDIMLLQHKALDEAPDNDPLVQLLMNPNPNQSQQEFFLSCFSYYLLYGECFIYKYRPGIGANGGNITELYSLSPSMIIIHVSKDYPQAVTNYEFVVGGQTIFKQIPKEDIIHIRKFYPENTYGYDAKSNYAKFRGLSPLVPAKKLLTRLSSSDDAAVKQLQNGGVPGIVYDDSPPPPPTQQSLYNTKQGFYDYLRSGDNKGMPFFMANKVGYVPLGLKLTDMELTNLQNMDFKRLCNIYKISTILFNSEVAATESNVKEMVKQMYTNVALPLSYTFRDKLNSELAQENWSDKKKRFINSDISEVTELQDDYKDLANVIATLPVTPTGNEIREIFRWDRIENEVMDVPLVKAGYSVIDELAMPAMPTD